MGMVARAPKDTTQSWRRTFQIPSSSERCHRCALVTPFVPAPLVELARRKGFLSFSATVGDAQVRTYFRKVGLPEVVMSKAEVHPPTGAQGTMAGGEAEREEMSGEKATLHQDSPRVAILQHVAPEGPGLIGPALASAGVSIELVRVDEGAEVPRDGHGLSWLVVLGGPMGVYEADQFPHLRQELRLIEWLLLHERPLLGVCLGSQLLAAALGARVYRSGRLEIGWLPVSLEPPAADDAMFAGAPEQFAPLHWHGDVFDLPSCAVRLARSKLTETQAFRYRSSVWGVLFHLEASVEQVAAMASIFSGDLQRSGNDGRHLVEEAASRIRSLASVAGGAIGAWSRLVARSAAS